jgi:thiamine transport system permease protein
MDRKGENRLWIWAGASALALIAAFCVLALVMLVIGGGEASSWPPAFYVARVALFTVGQAAASTILSVVLGLAVALAMARRQRFLGRPLLLALMILPLGLPVLPVVFGIVEVWGRQGWINDLLRAMGTGGGFSIYGLGGILLAHVLFNLPLVARLMLRALTKIPGNEWRLAASLDFPRSAIFRFVEAPALLRVLPGIAGLVFMLCITSFTIVLTLGGGPATSTLEVAIYQALKFEFDPSRALALCALQLVLTSVVFVLLNLFPDPEEDRGATETAPFRADAAKPAAIVGDGVVLLLFLLFVGSPLLAVLLAGLHADLRGLSGDGLFLQALKTSLLIAAAAGLLSVSLSYAILRGRQVLAGIGHRRSSALFRLPEFMLLIPPLALGAGWFVFLLKAGVGGNPAIVIVVAINCIMALPFTVRILAPEFRTHELRTARLADSLDIHGLDRFRIVDWPVLKGPLLTALSFGLALSLGDMGAIALFGSDDFITLPSLLYAKLGSYRSTDAAGLSLILGVLCLLLMLPALFSDRRRAELKP